MTALPSFAASQKIGPANTMLTGCAWKRKLVTTPKLPPPPRSAQKRSGCSLRTRGDEPAVGEDDVGLEQIVDREPVLARQVAGAAAQRQPGHAGAADDPERHGEAEGVRRVVDVRGAATRLHPHGPGWRGRRARSSSCDRSMTRPSSQLPSPGPLWPPPRMASSRPCSRAKFTAAMTSAASTHARDEARPLVDHAVVERANGVVVRVGRADEPAAKSLLECGDGLVGHEILREKRVKPGK